MKIQYNNLIDSCSLSDEQNLAIKATWLSYFKICDKNSWVAWWNYHALSIIVIVLGVFIPILEGSTIKVEILGKDFGIVSILGIIAAIIVGIMSHWKFESR